MKNKILILMILLLVGTVSAMDMNINMLPTGDIISGTYFNAQFNVINGASPLTNITFRLDEGDFDLQGDDEVKYNSIAPYQTLSLNYNLKANSGERTGYKNLELKISSGNDSLNKNFNVYVKSIESGLVINSVRSTPDKIVPGSRANVKISVNNKASYSLKNINLKLDFTNLPFAPIDSVPDKNIDEINSGSDSDVSFSIIALADAKTGIYKIPLKIIYFDEFGKQYNDSSLISLVIGSEPVIDVDIDENKLVIDNPSTFDIKIVNKGLTDIKFLTVRLNGDYEFVSNNNVYVGNIDSDSYETVEFKIIPREKNIAIPLLLTYKDANNQEYSKNVMLSGKILSISEGRSQGLIPSNTGMYIGIGIIVILIIYIVYRKLRKKKQ